LYAGQIPHDHIVVGGAAPLDWEQHGHLNPLLVFFGNLGSASPTDGRFTVADSVNAHPPSEAGLASGRIVSLYSGSLAIVLSVIAVAALCQLSAWILPYLVAVPLARPPSAFARIRFKVPPTPPPRSFSSSLVVCNQGAI
jgi:hypothetical protein